MLMLGCLVAAAQQVPPPAPPEIPQNELIALPPPPEKPEEDGPKVDVPVPGEDPAAELAALPGAPELPPPPPPPEAAAAGAGDGAVDAAVPIEQADGGFLIRDAALNDILQMLAKRAGKQYFHNQKVAGPEFNVSGHLNGGDPLEQMEALAFNAGLTLYMKGDTVYAMSREQLSQLPSKEWHYALRYLRPSDIEQIKALVAPMLSPGTGLVNYEPKTNTLVVIDSAHAIGQIEALMQAIDQAKGQITVEVKILSVNSAVGERVGVDWNTDLFERGIDIEASLNSIFGFNNQSGSVADSIVLTPDQIGGVLRALSKGGLVSQISNPALITEDNEEATISLIDRVPIITTTINQTQTTENITEEVRYQIDEKDPVNDPATTREIGVTMAVTPTVLPDGTIRMKMRPRSAQIVDFIEGQSGNTYPRVSESMIQTIARVPDGHSLLVGGFYGQVKQNGDNKVPLLGDVPIINFFFKSKDTSKESTSLVFVVTPTSYNPMSPGETCNTNRRLRAETSLDADHDWIDPSNPGRAHVPNFDRTLRAMNPTRPTPREPVESYQPAFEHCDGGAKRPARHSSARRGFGK